MRLLRATIRLAAAMAVAGAALAAAPQPAQACSCLYAPLSEYADEVDVAFTGRQIKRVEPRGIVSPVDDVYLILEVDRVYKGRAGPLISVVTGFSTAACGIDFSGEGLAELAAVAAFRWDGGLGVGWCGSQHAISDFQAVFGPGYPPDETMTQTLEQMEKAARVSIATTVLFAADHAPVPGPPPPPYRMPAVAIALLIWAAGFLLICGAAAVYHLRRRSGQGP